MEGQETTSRTSKTAPYSIIAGILFSLTAVVQVYLLTNYIGNKAYITERIIYGALIETVGFAIVAIALLRKQKGIMLPIGFAVLAIRDLVCYSSILSVLSFAFWLFAAFMSVVFLTTAMPQLRAGMRKLWFLPGIWRAIVFVAAVLWSAIPYKLQDLFCVSGILFAMRWVVCFEDVPADTVKTKVNTEAGGAPQTAHTAAPASEIYCDLVKHILLLLFTFGIWYFIWIYRMTGYLNCVEDEPPRDPTKKLLLCIFVPFYSIYWVYKSAQRIDKLAAEKGVASDLSTLCLILAIFVGIIPPILMQEKINTIIKAENAPAQQQTPAQVPKATLGTAEELKTYKELLDNGAITQEEFDAKKKQLLGL